MQQPKNKNILLLSTIYPVPEGNKGTKVCHYFTKEWMAMGYNVRVVNIVAVYPRILHWGARLATAMIEAKTGAVVYTKRAEKMHYEMDGVPVFLYPLFKMMPHGKFTQRAIREMIGEIVDDNTKNCFKPDFILGHFLNPALEVVSRLKDFYPEAKSTIVVHGDINQVESIYGGGRFAQFSKNIDCWGFRSRHVQKEFEEAAGMAKNPYICYSGIPESMLLTECDKRFDGELRSFNYTGQMIARKHPKAVAQALKKVYGDRPFCLKYVGEGGELGGVRAFVEENGMSDKVELVGKVPRSRVTQLMDEADCFVMISQGEAFGLVYLEAMARGCITIASRGEGVDGIIIDGENGFLCKAGDSNELADIIRRINALTPEQRKTISENGRKTVAVLTDKNVAKMYIEDVTNLSKINIQQQTTMYQGFTPPPVQATS